MTQMTMVQAINTALREEMERDDKVVILGEDVGVDGGIFRLTDGLIEQFGPERVLDTPLSETGIIGASVGMAINGMKPVPEMQFSGFSYEAFAQVENHVARFYKRTQGRFNMPITIRMPYGAGVHALEHHSESREVYYAHTPGLKVVMPSGPRNARALLKSAIRDPDPVIFMEPKFVYRAFREEVPEDEDETLPIGEPHVEQMGSDLTIVSWGAMMTPTRQAVRTLEEEDGLSIGLIDLRTVSPFDERAIVDSVQETGRLLVVHEAPLTFGPAGEIFARVLEHAFYHLEAPPMRITAPDVHTPLFAREKWYMPSTTRILDGARQLMSTE